MSLASAALVAPTTRPMGRVHVLGAGPVGLFLTALLQSIDGQAVRLYERRDAYTRTRMVSLAEYLIADSIESYKADTIDGQSVEAIFDPIELETRLAYRRTLAPDLRALLEAWTQGFVPLNTIERTLSELIDTRATGTVERVMGEVDAAGAIALLEPGDILVDCTGSRSVMRDLLVPGDIDPTVHGRNTTRFRLEYALVVTFLYDQHYACDEFCKYYKNVENADYKFIPAVHRTWYDGATSHVTGIVDHQQGRVRRDAADVRRHVAARQLPGRRGVDGPVHRQGEGRDARRAGGRPRDHPHPARRLPRPEHDEPARLRLSRSPVGRRRRSSCSGTPPSGRPTSSRSRWASNAPSSSPATSATGRCPSRTCSSGTRRSCTGSGCGSTCGPR